jgi:hypothetical protein
LESRSSADPTRQQDWFLKCLQGGRVHPLAALWGGERSAAPSQAPLLLPLRAAAGCREARPYPRRHQTGSIVLLFLGVAREAGRYVQPTLQGCWCGSRLRRTRRRPRAAVPCRTAARQQSHLPRTPSNVLRPTFWGRWVWRTAVDWQPTVADWKAGSSQRNGCKIAALRSPGGAALLDIGGRCCFGVLPPERYVWGHCTHRGWWRTPVRATRAASTAAPRTQPPTQRCATPRRRTHAAAVMGPAGPAPRRLAARTCAPTCARAPTCGSAAGRGGGARWVTLRARWVTLRARWVTLRARWVTLRARWVTLRPCWVTLRALTR